MSAFRSVLVILGGLALLIGSSAGATATAKPQYPVPYDLFVQDSVRDPYGSAVGSNDWNCVPSPAHPEPVVLLHGLGANRFNLFTTISPLLANEGYCVFALTYGIDENLPAPFDSVGGLGQFDDSAVEVAEFVDRVRGSTGAQKVDIVAISEGTLVGDYYVKYLGGERVVDKFVSLGPLWRGSLGTGPNGDGQWILDLASDDARTVIPFCAGCPQGLPASGFLAKLWAGGETGVAGPYAPTVTYTNIMTRYDQLVLPFTSGYVVAPNATNIVVQDGCSQDYSDHLALAASRVATGHVLHALDLEDARAVPCVFVTPFRGG
ncbi:esterase/lipase family protein [Rhodococcus sp. IEGM 1318]|uniref:esterase/lipase family protein n=1 Tax=Rhodococcus sp. IEGM 1318 TaxID=3082226 RepID=UPI0029537D7F|nr:alpha/beta fold hydrolase [Rhodococcus sp. IEGM 1318]MDV8009473.1 lipase [Rhodococcus sp. IEGM 1318]